MAALDLVHSWPVDHVAAGVVTLDAGASSTGDTDRPFPLASVTKLLATMATLIAVEEGSIELDEPATTMPGVTVRHLLAHTSGLPFEGEEAVARPGVRRIYSNTGIERLAGHVEARTGIPFATYLDEAVLHPLGLHGTDLADRSPASGAVAPIGRRAPLRPRAPRPHAGFRRHPRRGDVGAVRPGCQGSCRGSAGSTRATGASVSS